MLLWTMYETIYRHKDERNSGVSRFPLLETIKNEVKDYSSSSIHLYIYIFQAGVQIFIYCVCIIIHLASRFCGVCAFISMCQTKFNNFYSLILINCVFLSIDLYTNYFVYAQFIILIL